MLCIPSLVRHEGRNDPIERVFQNHDQSHPQSHEGGKERSAESPQSRQRKRIHRLVKKICFRRRRKERRIKIRQLSNGPLNLNSHLRKIQSPY